MLTVIDDSVLAGGNYGFVRDFIREKFIIRAIISLHGDAFQRAGARAKTSALYLEKRTGAADETQPAAFVYESRYIGLDDVVPRTRASIAALATKQAAQETDEIADAFSAYLDGKKGPWLVPAERLSDRLDAKHLRPWSADKLKPAWRAAGADSEVLENLVDPVSEPVKLEPDSKYTFLRITYEGRAERGESALGKEISYARVGRTRVGDIVVSNISAVYKAICVIQPGMEDLLVSNEFIVLRLKPGVKADPFYLLSVLRSSAIIAQWISNASGVGRHRVDWQMLRTQTVPLLPEKEQRRIGALYNSAVEHEAEIARAREAINATLAPLDLESAEALDRLARAKPPK